MFKKIIIILVLFLPFSFSLFAQNNEAVFPGADEKTPSKAQYFSWINSTNEGPTEAQTLINLEFFRWLYEEYGMRLDMDSETLLKKNQHGLNRWSVCAGIWNLLCLNSMPYVVH